MRLFLTVGLLVAAPSAAPADKAALTKALAELPADPPAPLNNDQHYLVSNEGRLDFFFRHTQGRSGVHLGVGTDPNYLIAGWSRAEWVVLFDFDPWVVDLHRVYRAFFRVATDRAHFLRLWSADGVSEAERVLELEGADAPRLAERYRGARARVSKRLGDLARGLRGFPSFLHDDESFAHLADLARRGRILAVGGDLTGPHALFALATALREAGLVVRTLYLSNAEQYFMYRPPFRANLLALPFDDRSIVLRTLPGRPKGFEYILQSGLGFQAWVGSPKTTSVYAIRGLVKGHHLVGDREHVIGDLPSTTAPGAPP
jgi:hypothetical protein